MENGIYIGLTSNKFELKNPGTWLSGLIQFFTKSKWNHAVVVLIFHQYSIVIHAQAWVRIEMFDDWCKKSDRDVALFLTLKPVDKLWLFRQINRLYDVMGLVWQLIFILTGKWLGSKGIKADEFFFCSELTVRMMAVPDPFLYAPKNIPSLVPKGYLQFIANYKTKKGSPDLHLDTTETAIPIAA